MPNKKVISLPIASGIAVGLLILGFTVGAVAQSRTQLTILQNTVPTDARKIGGKLYVPIADIAKAMGWKLTVAGSTISLQPPSTGQSPQATTEKTAGAVNEELSTGTARFQVIKVAEMLKYERHYANGLSSGVPVIANPNQKLVVLDCVLTNATNEREEYCLSSDRYAENTVLLDKTGESLSPVAVDVAADEMHPPGAYALPGANVRFALVFQVPGSWQPKALVYTIVRYRARGLKKGNDVRVNL